MFTPNLIVEDTNLSILRNVITVICLVYNHKRKRFTRAALELLLIGTTVLSIINIFVCNFYDQFLVFFVCFFEKKLSVENKILTFDVLKKKVIEWSMEMFCM